jgi:hypothetical protein
MAFPDLLRPDLVSAVGLEPARAVASVKEKAPAWDLEKAAAQAVACSTSAAA